MRRMYSENQLIELIQKYGGQVSPEDIQAMFDDGDVSLAGKYAKVMDAPNADSLTDEEIANLVDGIHIEGTFLNFKNPLVFPNVSTSSAIALCGIIGEPLSGGIEIRRMQIDLTTKKAALESSPIFKMDYNGIVMKSLASVNDKEVPNYPANTGTFALKCVDGVLTWVADAE